MARRHRYGKPDQNQEGIFEFARNHLDAEVRNTTAVGRGFPDGVVGWRGLTVLVEVKRPKKGKLEASQQDFQRTWRGGPYLVVESGDDLVRQLLALDLRTPPVRGRPVPMPVADAIAKAATAIQAQNKLKAEGHTLPSGYLLDVKAILEELVRSTITWQERRQ